MALPLSYHWRNLFVRKTTTLLTVLVVAAVVGVFTWLVGFSESVRRSLLTASDPQKLIVLRPAATSESNSAIPVEDYNKLKQVTDLAREPESLEPLISPEMMVQVALPRLRDQGRTWGNVALRGVLPIALQIHTNVETNGKMFAPGSREVLVGATAAKQFGGLEVGQKIQLGFAGDREYTIVGHFTAHEGPLESEIWGYLPSLMNAYNRSMYSSVHLRLTPGADSAKAIEEIKGPAVQLEARTESQYWQEQSANIEKYLVWARRLVRCMAMAVVCSIAITMYATVAGRASEIAMLRIIGYSRAQILAGFMLESLLITALGGIFGSLACLGWLGFMGNTKDMFGTSSFTTLAFEIQLNLATVLWTLGSVVAMGVAGAIFPARRASRIQVIQALREP